MIGQTLSHFKITAKLGEGGMGEVYRAEDTKLGREVAIKVLPEAFVQDAERLARFEREARVLAALDHPNIAGIYEVGEHDGIHFLAMQLAEGEDLAKVLATGTPSLEMSLAISLQIATALEAAHASGIVHRDLKPANVKVAFDGGSGVAVKVLDFGLAKAWDQGSSGDSSLSMSPTLTAQMTQAGVILGTAGYMSPEQARGQVADARADVWSFGVMLWEMVTGNRLFQEDTVSDTLAAVLKTQIDLDQLPDDLPPPIHRLVSRCLDRDVRGRLQAIGEARVAIEGFLADPDAEKPVPYGHPIPESAPSSSTLRRWAPVATAVLVAGIVSSFVTRELQPEPVPPPVRRFTVEAEGYNPGWSRQPVISPDGTAIAYPLEQGIAVHSLAQLEPRAFEGASDVRWVTWSPDSRHLAFETSESKIYRVDLARGGVRLVAESPGGRRSLAAAWLADDTIVFAVWRRSAYRVSANGGEPEVLIDLAESEDIDVHRFLSLPEDHGILAVIHNESEWRLVCLRGDEMIRLETLVPHAYTSDGRLLFSRLEETTLWAAPFDPNTLEFTGDPVLVAEDVGWASYSNDDTLLFGSDSGQPTGVPARVDRQGAVLETFGDPVENLQIPVLSPDGRFIAAEYRADGSEVNNIFVYDRQRSVWSRLTSGDTDQGYVNWSADGARLYFRNGSNIAVIRRDGVGGLQELFPGHSPLPSKDGKSLLFMRDPSSLMIVDLGEDGLPESEPRLVEGPAEGSAFRGDVSPDGRFLVYGASEAGSFEVYLTEFPESRSRWQVSRDGGGNPRWAPGGSAITYLRHGEIWEVPFELDGDTPQLGSASALFSGSAFNGDIRDGGIALSDGSFLVVQGAGDDADQVVKMVVVQSAMAELD